jgi:predicted dinucleotide-binding enzyme
MPTLGLIGAGHIGGTLAKLAVDAGYDVVLSNSRGPETLAELVAQLGPKARAATPAEAAAVGDLVVVTIPLKHYKSVPVEPLVGKIVIDTNNYYPGRDGRIPELDSGKSTSSELLQAHLPRSKVVKAFNHIYFEHLKTQGRPSGTKGRRALTLSGNDAEARQQVARFIEAIGYDVLDMGPLSESWRVQPDQPAYNVALDVEGMKAALAKAKR